MSKPYSQLRFVARFFIHKDYKFQSTVKMSQRAVRLHLGGLNFVLQLTCIALQG